MKKQKMPPAIRIAIIYAIFAGMWILFSDLLLFKFVKDPFLLTHYQTYKGWLFILVTAILLYIERILSESSLRKSEHLYRLMANNFPNGAVFLFDHNLRYIIAEGMGLAEVGLSKELLEGKTICEVFSQEICKILEPYYHKAIKGVSGSVEVFFNEHIYFMHYLPVRNEDNEVIAGMVVAQDITSRKKDEEEIKKLNTELEIRVQERTAQLEEINAELQAFSYSVSHDLRAPLRSVEGFCQMLREDYFDVLGEQGKDYINRIQAAIKRMTQLINDLLNLSRITRSEMKKTTVDMSEIAQSIIADLKKNQPERKVEVDITPGLIVNADEGLMRTVLENLLGNAWKFTRNREIARIEFGVTEQEGKNVYYIRDNGAGFDMEYVSKLFGPFQRLHTTAEFEGTGIGLATVKRIINRHGGKVWAEGEVDKGATIYFTIP